MATNTLRFGRKSNTSRARRNMMEMVVSAPCMAPVIGLASSSRCDMVDLTVRSRNVRRAGSHRSFRGRGCYMKHAATTTAATKMAIFVTAA